MRSPCREKLLELHTLILETKYAKKLRFLVFGDTILRLEKLVLNSRIEELKNLILSCDEEDKKCHILEIPTELLWKIMEFVTPYQVKNVRKVCTAFCHNHIIKNKLKERIRISALYQRNNLGSLYPLLTGYSKRYENVIINFDENKIEECKAIKDIKERERQKYCYECYRKDKSVKRCSGCHRALYCGVECQKKARNYHKWVCKL